MRRSADALVELGAAGIGRDVGLRRIGLVAPEHRVEGERQDRATSGQAGRDGRGWRRTGTCAPRDSRPKVGFSPKAPQNELGTRIEPLVSEPSEIGTRPAATAAPEPPDEPPDMWSRSCGLREGPSWAFSPVKS